MRIYFSILFAISVATAVAQKPQLIVPAGHTGEITSVAISPDGKYILTGSGDNTAKLWDFSGHEIRTFAGHEFVVSAVAFSPDGKSVLTGSYDGTAKLWAIAGGKPQNFSGHKNYVTSVAFSPDGESILTGSYDRTVKLWNISTGKERQSFGASGKVSSVAFSPDGTLVVAGDDSGAAQCWTLTGATKQVFKHTGAVKSVAFSSDSKLVLAGCLDGTAKLWNLAGHIEQTILRSNPIHAVAISPDKKLLLTGCFDDGVVEIQTRAGEKKLDYGGHIFGINAAVFSPDGKYVLTGSADRTARLWDLSGETVGMFSNHIEGISALTCSPDGQFLLIGNRTGAVKITDLKGIELLSIAAHKQEISSVAFSPDGQFFLTGSHDGAAKLFGLKGQEIKTFSGHKGWVNAVAFSPDGQRILTGGFDKTAILQDITGGNPKVLKHQDEVTAVAFSPDGHFLTSSADGVARLWNASGVQVNRLDVGSQIKSVAISPDGKKILTGSYNGLTKLWDRDGQPIETIGRAEFSSEIRAVAFSPKDGGQSILTGGTDKTARLWNTADGSAIYTFRGHTADLRAVSFLPGGKFVVTGSLDGTAKIWDVASGTEAATFIPIDSNDWVVTTPNGFFDASENAMNVMYYANGLEVIELEQLKQRYYEPHLLQKILGYVPGGLRSVNDLDGLALFPLITQAKIKNDRVKVELEERSGGIGKVVLLLDEHIALDENANPNDATAFDVDLDRFADHFIPDTVNHLSLRVYNRDGWLLSPHYPLEYRPESVRGRGLNDGNSTLRSKKDVSLDSINLYALIVGTSNYRGEHLTLKYPDKDAAAFAEALQLTGSKLFGENMEITLLTTSKEPWPRKAEIAKALRDIASKADPNDILLVYLSGHGITYPPNSEKGQFHYLTTNILDDKLDNPATRANDAIAQDTLQEWIRQVSARKRILILDACNSGRVVETQLALGEKALNSDQRRALERIKDKSGMFVLAGSAADKSSFEASRFGHGLLTYSLLNNMPLVAAQNKKFIEVGALFNNALEEVPRLAKDIGRDQNPELIGSGSWPIGIIDGPVPFEIPQSIPVFLRTNFMNIKKNKDTQHLGKALNNYLESLASEKKASLVYWDLTEFNGDHYYIGGQYQVNGEAISGNVTLYRKDAELTNFQFPAPGESVSDLDALAEYILNNVFDFLSK